MEPRRLTTLSTKGITSFLNKLEICIISGLFYLKSTPPGLYSPSGRASTKTGPPRKFFKKSVSIYEIFLKLTISYTKFIPEILFKNFVSIYRFRPEKFFKNPVDYMPYLSPYNSYENPVLRRTPPSYLIVSNTIIGIFRVLIRHRLHDIIHNSP